ncbi:hypothetical protein [Azospirillum endophyticum]
MQHAGARWYPRRLARRRHRTPKLLILTGQDQKPLVYVAGQAKLIIDDAAARRPFRRAA